VARVIPAVVTVRSARRVRPPRQHPFFDDPSIVPFRGHPPVPPQQAPGRRQLGLGSGVVVSPNGYILTNHHVIDGAEEISVELNDGRDFEARVIGTDPPSDLAVLRVEAEGLPALGFGDSDRVQIGDVVLAVGNPLGIGQTVTSGIVSAKARSTGLSDGNFEDFLQTDAAINQGNSGGALVNVTGELIGINSQILSPSGGNIGIGFAIPSNMARDVMEQLVETGEVRRGQLGVVIQPVTDEVASEIGLAEGRGLLIVAVRQGGAAARSGLRPGDVILAFNGAQVSEPNTFRNLVASTPPGTEVTLTVLRDGRQSEVQATLDEYVAERRS
jgi:Do/DeqQ family serine protease